MHEYSSNQNSAPTETNSNTNDQFLEPGGKDQMRKLFGFLFLGLAAFMVSPMTAIAYDILYTAQGTYGSGALAGDPFTLTFSVPSSLTGSFSAGLVTVTTFATYSEGGSTISEPAQVVFFDTAQGGLFDIDLGDTITPFDVQLSVTGGKS